MDSDEDKDRLSISPDLARAMGAELSVESKLDEGSTFILSLPRGKTETK